MVGCNDILCKLSTATLTPNTAIDLYAGYFHGATSDVDEDPHSSSCLVCKVFMRELKKTLKAKKTKVHLKSFY